MLAFEDTKRIGARGIAAGVIQTANPAGAAFKPDTALGLGGPRPRFVYKRGRTCHDPGVTTGQGRAITATITCRYICALYQHSPNHLESLAAQTHWSGAPKLTRA